jgi:WD40 repeat protein/tRNA A-37 threonylcarbamoyl transferase component Bud32
MSAERKCPDCGAVIPPDAPEGLCPRCELAGAMQLGSPATTPDNEWAERGNAHGGPGANLGSSVLSPLGRVRYFGDYELLEEIAKGGMGVVYKARQMSLNRRVALKMIRSDSLVSPNAVRRFHAEAEAAANLDHPNIIPIYEIGEHEGQHYFSMKLVEGPSLAHELSRKDSSFRMDHRKGAKLLATVARAVHYAHQRGILHRDLKPSNILLDAQEEPAVADFGLAKRLDEAAGLTLTGEAMGTPAYTAPEQASGKVKQLTTAVDVYSLGAILYELLTGQPPFRAETPLETLRKVVEEEPRRPSTITRLVDRDLETICLKCLEKEPQRRYGSAEEVAEELERWLRQEPIRARPVGAWSRVVKWAGRHPGIAATGGVAALLLIIIAVGSPIALVRISAERSRAEANAAAEAEQRRLAEAGERETRDRLVRARVASGARLLDEGDYLGALPWFVDALQLDHDNPAGELEHRIRITSVLRWCPTLLRLWMTGGMDAHATFNEDGSWVAVSGEKDTVQVWNVESGQAVSPVIDHGEDSWVLFQFRPGHKQLLTFGELGQWAKLWDVESGRCVASFTQPQLRTCSFSKNGRLLAAGSNAGVLTIWDLESGSVLFSNSVHRGYINSLDFSPDNERLITSSKDRDTKIFTADRGQEVLSVTHADGVFHVEFDAGGRRFLTACFDGTARVWNAQTGEPLTPPLTHKRFLWRARFSPGDRYVVSCSADQTAKIWDAATGIQLAEPLEIGGGMVDDCAFSQDGRLVATLGTSGHVNVWLLPQGKLVWPALVHTRRVSHIAFHPDGRRLLTACSDGQVRLWNLMPRDGFLDPPGLQDRKLTKASAAGDLLLAETTNNEVGLVNTLTWQPTGTQIKESYPIHGRFLSADNRRLLTITARQTGGAEETRLNLWDMATGQLIAGSVLPEFPRGACASKDCRFIAWITNRVIHMFETATGRRVGEALGTGDEIDQLVFSSDGSQIAVASHDRQVAQWKSPGMVTVWNPITGQPTFPPLKHAYPVSSVGFSPNGQWLVTACSAPHIWLGRSAYVWDAVTGRSASPPLQHAQGVLHATFSSDSKLLLTGGEDGIARVWDFLSGKAASPHLALPGYVVGAAFGHSNRWIAVSCFNHLTTNSFTRVWSVAHGEPLTLLLPCPGDRIGQIQFIANGRYLYAHNPYTQDYAQPGNKVRQIWDLTADTRPVEDLQALAHLLSGRKLDVTGVLEPVELAVLAQAWDGLKRRYPEQFVSPTNTSPFWPPTIVRWSSPGPW